MGRRTWIKVWCLPWTEGRIREAPLAIRGTFITLCCLVGDSKYADEGLLQVADGIGFSDHQVAGMLHCDMRTWAEHKTTLQEFKKPDGTPDPLIEIGNDNIIKVLEWERFEPDYRRYRAKSHSSSHTKVKRQKEKKKEKEIKKKETTREESGSPLLASPDDQSQISLQAFIDEWNAHKVAGAIRQMGEDTQKAFTALSNNPGFRRDWRLAVRGFRQNTRICKYGVSWFLKGEHWIGCLNDYDEEHDFRRYEECPIVEPSSTE